MNLYNLHDKPEDLHRHKHSDNVPEVFWDNKSKSMSKKDFKTFVTSKEAQMNKTPKYAFKYATEVLRKAFPAGEDQIAKNADYSFKYARDALKKPFPKGEDAIAKNPWLATQYALQILKGKFPKGEKAIATEYAYAINYAVLALKEPWKPAEDLMTKDAVNDGKVHADLYHKYVNTFPERKDALEKKLK